MKLEDAEAIALDLLEKMKPHCERIEIAGSIRRRKPEVKDIEIVAVPKWSQIDDPTNLFSVKIDVNHLYLFAQEAQKTGEIGWVRRGAIASHIRHIRPDGKYWCGLLPEGIKLDLFLPFAENFGLIYAIRTGSAEFSQALVTHAGLIGWPCIGGFIAHNGSRYKTPEEADVFRILGLEYVRPEDRIGFSSLRNKYARSK